jgi:hypothetical protein
MSLVRIPRLWSKRHYYHDWRSLNENRDYNEKDARELFRHEEMRWNYYEEETRNQQLSRQSTLVGQINSLSSYISNVLTVSNPNIGLNQPMGDNLQRALDSSKIQEIITEDGIYLILENGNILGPYLGA